MHSKVRNALIALSMILYVASFFLPTATPFNAEWSEIRFTGWEAFRAGWRAILIFEPHEPDAWIFAAAWLTNPLFWLAVVTSLYERHRVARMSAWIGVALCLPVLFRFGMMMVSHPGYWCWLGSVVLLALVNSKWVPTKDKPAVD